jgi:hypothetical protein
MTGEFQAHIAFERERFRKVKVFSKLRNWAFMTGLVLWVVGAPPPLYVGCFLACIAFQVVFRRRFHEIVG